MTLQHGCVILADHIVCLKEILWVAPYSSELPVDSVINFKNGDHLSLMLGREAILNAISNKHHYIFIDDHIICIEEIQWVAPYTINDQSTSVVHFKNGTHVVIRAPRKEILDQASRAPQRAGSRNNKKD